ncbi:MAG TPA: ATP-binding protein [Candidatus Acidoferrum sp.]|nr:ATP-binding protein [Candidatus Acidoferrum sp.]
MPRVANYSITKKLTRMNMLVSGAALLIACAAFVAYDLVTFRQAMVYNLSIQAQMAGSNSVSPLLFNDPQAAENTLSALKAAPNVLSAGIYALDGRPFATYWRNAHGQSLTLPKLPASQTETHWFKDGQLVLVRTIVFDGKPTGTVYIRSDLREMTRRLKRYGGIAAVVLSASLIAALLVASIFQRAVAEPIVHLAEVARIVSREKNYALRATPTGKRDEPDVLIAAFNEMLGQIQERDGALHQAHDELEQRVEERTAQLAAANKELEAFSYSVSHDLRAPLRSIDGFSLALLEDYADRLDEEGKNDLQRIRAATQRMGVLIDDLLNLSRMTRAEIRKEIVNLSTLARSVAQGLQEVQPERRIDFRIEDHLEAKADARLVRVVLENLIGNACKFTSKMSSACVEFGKTHQNGNSAYYVRDNGAGFDPAYANRLFGAFQRLHGVTEFPGTGIGLATVQRIIHRHGGKIWAEGAVEKGATFYFTL